MLEPEIKIIQWSEDPGYHPEQLAQGPGVHQVGLHGGLR